MKGLGTGTVASPLITFGDNPEDSAPNRRSRICAASRRSPASSGKTNRHRLNRGGDRQANHALYMIAVSRMAWEPRACAYAAQRTAEGKTKPEIIRCLKRHIAREISRQLVPRTLSPTATT
ncbi:transposase [Actinomadura coerulea]|uniref:transposase n=1 Tax=Actinomadura coerulea TaxID=46159 RepID=UPI0034311AFB